VTFWKWDGGIERGSIRSPSVEDSVWKKLCTCHKTDYMIMITFTSAATEVTFLQAPQLAKLRWRKKINQQ
jgi:hypothetical protein